MDAFVAVVSIGINICLAGIFEFPLLKRRSSNQEVMAKLSSTVISRTNFIIVEPSKSALNKKELGLLDSQDMVPKAK
jgi:hypothetical protein